MDQIWQRAALIFEKKPNELELYIIKPDILNLIQDLDNSSCEDHRTFQILNTFAIEYKSIVTADLDIMKAFVLLVSKFLKKKGPKALPELGKKWALRMLRWILVVEPEASNIEELKKCFLMGFSVNKFYQTQLEIGLGQLVEKISLYISVKDFKLLTISIDGFAKYFKIDPLLMGEKIIGSAETVLKLMSNHLYLLTDDFVSNLLLDSSGYYYKSIDMNFKKGLCSCFIDIFEYEVLNLRDEDLLNSMKFRSNWFILWLSRELQEFQKFQNFRNSSTGCMRIFLDRVKEEIIELGLLKGFHSRSTYEKIK